MIDPKALTQVKAFARIDGLLMSLVWFMSMGFTLYRTESIWGLILMLCTPFFVGWRLSVFRDNVLEERISFRRALCYSCYVFFYASIIFALGQIIYLKYIDDGTFINYLNGGIETFKALAPNNKSLIKDMESTRDAIQLMGPANIALMLFMNNLFLGAFLSPVIALFCKHNKQKYK